MEYLFMTENKHAHGINKDQKLQFYSCYTSERIKMFFVSMFSVEQKLGLKTQSTFHKLISLLQRQ